MPLVYNSLHYPRKGQTKSSFVHQIRPKNTSSSAGFRNKTSSIYLIFVNNRCSGPHCHLSVSPLSNQTYASKHFSRQVFYNADRLRDNLLQNGQLFYMRVRLKGKRRRQMDLTLTKTNNFCSSWCQSFQAVRNVGWVHFCDR